ncbi:Wadjet anti-phage system protein JetD domain-containing protein [Cytobacillus sp. FJAT-54145]|uniref:Wadjet anti-phage system protein JetD domain-containing protein n=1 Tax=Cytobacillus spartinae TaxID=3299023 RepID=A0ABW6KDB2_9BACI
MRDLVIQVLLKFSKKTIGIEELETFLPLTDMSYEQFAKLVLSLEEEGILEMVKSHGRNMRTPSLAYSYRIQTKLLKQDLHQEIFKLRLQLHPSIELDQYFKIDPSNWKDDLPYIYKIHDYIEKNGLPEYEVPAPERSVELVGDEKWIDEKQGKELLERIGLLSAMKVIPVSDPIMFAVNPATITNQNHLHLIVENKTTFQALMHTLPETSFTTLIYGSGNRIIKSIEQFERQLPIANAQHTFFYFGDIDRSGIFIWYRLNEKKKVHPYIPFYRGCLEKAPLEGKSNQRFDQEALLRFLPFFTKEESDKLQSMLAEGKYFPQEVLKTKELQEIWRQNHGVE